MASAPQILACGEIVIAASRPKAPRCSCGKSREVCSVWGALLTPDRPPGSWAHEDLARALLAQAEGRFEFVSDSSKTAWGSFWKPFGFRQKLGPDFRFVQIVRDPHGVCWSNISGRRRRHGELLPDIETSPKRFLRHARTLLGWWCANIACELFRWRHPGQTAKVRYEDLVRSPEETVSAIFETLQLGPAPDFSVGEPVGNGAGNRHQLFGSRVRFRNPSETGIRHDTRWECEMQLVDRWLISAFTWPLRWLYGY